MYEDPQELFREMDEMFNRLFSRMEQGFARNESHEYDYRIVIRHEKDPGVEPDEPAVIPRGDSAPKAEVHRIENEVKVIVELPGATAESVALAITGGTLTIDAGGCMQRYHTSVDLPPVDTSSMESTFRNGVLEVTLRSVG
jgi:HSP20 family molecular chaperone IbpA